MVSKVRVWQGRNLSYIARLTLINSVLAAIYIYWSSMFIIPSSVIHQVKSICISFLWTGKLLHSGLNLVAWDVICRKKKEGGLGLKDLNTWNKAFLGKLVWDVAHKSDSLWVKWVHHIYIKRTNWWQYLPPQGTPWYWHHICNTKESILANMVSVHLNPTSIQRPSTSQMYTWFRPPISNLPWSTWVWNHLNIPKTCFMGWLACHGRLKTKARLKRLGISLEDECPVCLDGVEDEAHVLFGCVYSQACLNQLSTILQKLPAYSMLDQLLSWLRNTRRLSKKEKKVYCAILFNLVYGIWMNRNRVVHEKAVLRPVVLVRKVLGEVSVRLGS